MAFGLMSNILGLFLIASRILPSAQIECASKINLKYGEMNEVSCEYPLSFLSVRWYRGRDSAPIARIEGGSKSVTQGYDITVRGNLQINQVDVSHAGIYNITVLDIDGRDDTKAMNAHVTAGLTENPILERCASTRLTLCSGVAELAKATTLICSAYNTLPAVDFKWYHLINAQNQTLNSSSSQYIRNETSMLFSSYSTLSYEPSAFTLNIFTCKATVLAASSDALESSILVEGTVPPQKTAQVVRPGQINSIVEFKCSDSAPLLASWKVVYPNRTIKALWDIYPGSTSGNCSSRRRCHVDHMAKLTVYDVQKWDEAAYECVYFDGDHSGKTIVQLRVVVRPDPYRIVIQGCNDTLNCKLDVVTFQGTFKVSVNGARPSAELLCEVADESKAEVSAFNTEKNVIEHVEMGTYDTEVIIEYDIHECVERVHVVCHIPPNTVHGNLSALNIVLISDVTSCSTSNTGLVVGLIVGILIFAVAISIAMCVILRKAKVCSRKKTGKDNEQHQLEEQREEEEPLLKDNFDTFLDSFCLTVKKTKEVPVKEFRRLMAYFKKECEPDEPRVSLVNRISKTSQPEEVLHIVLRYLARETVLNELSVENFTKIFESLITKSKISLSDFDSAKMRLLQSNTEPYPNILQFIYDLYQKDQYKDNTLLILLLDTLREYVVHDGEMGQEKKQNEILQYKKAYEDSFQKETNIKEELKTRFILKIVDTFLMLREDVKKAIGDLFKDDEIKKRRKKEKGKAEDTTHEPKK
ncbi:hypothetical protein HOLleu_21484 [Holothuria leucospilota]|uniref:Ig-like domain-containing protein n=1 Tax=Holothuria leucospilota TaxID=206669 RepID=A0A9Q1BXK5_HOLLE|nr:hypothetical protein HOLleu_21484 [Holothuria leucospilota]